MKIFLTTLLAVLMMPVTCVTVRAQVPLYSSFPSAAATIFLDFDGHYVTGGPWNWNGPIDAQPSEINNTGITEIYNRMAEDFRPFDVNITTDSTAYLAAPVNRRMRVIVTATSSWYGPAGGVAYVGSFTWGDDTPCWVFSSLLGNNVKYVSEACAHEAGHTIGMHHQSTYNASCSKIAEYNGGQGYGETGWAPIMGVGYYKNLTTWHNGPNAAGCNVLQDDVYLLSSRLGFRADDHGSTTAQATALPYGGSGFMISGVINQADDADVFSLALTQAAQFQLSAIPYHVSSGHEGANIDIRLTLLGSGGDTVASYNPEALLSAGIDTALASGTYYVVVNGAGNANQSAYGSLGFYSLHGSAASVLPVQKFRLQGAITADVHTLSWSFSDEHPLENLAIEYSGDGKTFQTVVVLQAGERRFHYKPFSTARYYRVKAIAKNGKTAYSNTVFLDEINDRHIRVTSTLIRETMMVSCSGSYPYTIYELSGRPVRRGTLSKGINTISVAGLHRGCLLLQVNDGGTQWTEKLIKL